MNYQKSEIREIASKLLRDAKITSVPIPVERVAKHLGLLLVDVDENDDSMSGFFLRDNEDGNAVIGVNRNHPENRKRFTIAHEIGHCVLHPSNSVFVDEVYFRDKKSAEGTDSQEREANLFAAELLMPKTLLESDVAKIGQIRLNAEKLIDELAKKYRVSSLAMTYRLNFLKLAGFGFQDSR